MTIDFGAVLVWLTCFSAVAILVSGLDDLFIDVCYYGSQLSRRLFRNGPAEVTEAELRALPEQGIAIMIPAWHEDAVIAHMLRNTLSTVEYRNYDVFVGTYPNDEATMLAVAGVAEADPRVHRIVCPHDGPTNKADCLNWIIEGIRHYDKETGKRISILMLHDSEDLVHPLSLKLMNRFIPEAAMVQLPVIPFESPAGEMTAGTYLDEFAESHLKDMVVRERLSGMVPSAGVGTGFSRAAIERLALKHNNQVFNVGTFTEDYDLAFRLKAIGERSMLLQFTVERTLVEGTKLRIVRELVGTREYFPSNFSDAVRQKARWTLGIVFHGWQQRGWEGDLPLRYMIWRDRKALMTNSVNILGYLLLLEAALGPYWLPAGEEPGRPPFIPADGWVWKVILVDALLLFNRCVQRVACDARISSWKQAALSLPRIIWGNVINFCAVVRATHIFLRNRLTGEKLVWAKTAHAFPSEAQLLGYKRKLGDLLLEQRRITLSHLSAALQAQKGTGKRLGDILVDNGWAKESEIVSALAGQLKVEARVLDYAQLRREDLDLIIECACREHLMVVADARSRPVIVAAAVVGDERMKGWLDANFPYPYRLVLAGRRNIVEIIERAGEARTREGLPPHRHPHLAPPPRAELMN
ncbi:MAG: glycosyl transferase family protein [Elusimicrobia bacterium]|nr:glycosyl transferase family protein [Elusimicrobiota bacterium]